MDLAKGEWFDLYIHTFILSPFFVLIQPHYTETLARVYEQCQSYFPLLLCQSILYFFAGAPAIIILDSSKFLVTTELAPIILLFPILTSPHTTAFVNNVT
jgi:hypothetical protein